MTVWNVLEIEVLVALFAFGLAYGAFTLLLWWLSRDSERRQRARVAQQAADGAPVDGGR